MAAAVSSVHAKLAASGNFDEQGTAFQTKTETLRTCIEELKQSAFVPVRCTGCDDGFGGIMCGTASGIGCQYPAACEMAMSSKAYGGFWGPFIDVPEPV